MLVFTGLSTRTRRDALPPTPSAAMPILSLYIPGALVMYRALHDQIAFLKKQQWTITNYLLLLYAAVFAVKKENLQHALTC